MSAILMDGIVLANQIKNEIKEKVSQMKDKPGLVVVMAGDNPASKVYVNAKKKDCEECGIKAFDYPLWGDKLELRLMQLIDILNKDRAVDGILVQLPLPEGIDTRKILSIINPKKDVDVFLEQNLGALMIGNHQIAPCTPSGIMTLLKAYDIDVEGKKCVIVNRSNLIGKPLSMLMTHANATVTLCHTYTPNLIDECRSADILVTATAGGIKVTADWIKEGAVIIDASTNRDENGKLCGDVQMDDVILEKASYITPVPGGVGPMTRAMLMYNTLYTAVNFHGKK